MKTQQIPYTAMIQYNMVRAYDVLRYARENKIMKLVRRVKWRGTVPNNVNMIGYTSDGTGLVYIYDPEGNW
jgi:hypothetical protein